MTLDDLARALDAPAGWEASLLAAAAPAFETLAVAGVRAGVYAGTSPDGTPFAPLRHPGGKPLLNTAVMAQGVTAKMQGDELTLRSTAPQASLQHFGGTVTPTRGQFLAVPLTAEARRAGSPRAFPRPLDFRRKGGPRAKGRPGVMLDDAGTAQYALVKSVTLPPRPWLGFSAETAEDLGDELTRRYAAFFTNLARA